MIVINNYIQENMGSLLAKSNDMVCMQDPAHKIVI